jgi:hypothetical protein
VWAIRPSCSYAKQTLHEAVWVNRDNIQVFLSYVLDRVVIFMLRPDYYRRMSSLYPLYRRSSYEHTCTCYKHIFLWRVSSSGIWRRVVSCHLLARCCAELFYDPEDGGDTFLRNVGYHSTHSPASYPRRRYSSKPPLWKPQILHLFFFCPQYGDFKVNQTHLLPNTIQEFLNRDTFL